MKKFITVKVVPKRGEAWHKNFYQVKPSIAGLGRETRGNLKKEPYERHQLSLVLKKLRAVLKDQPTHKKRVWGAAHFRDAKYPPSYKLYYIRRGLKRVLTLAAKNYPKDSQ